MKSRALLVVSILSLVAAGTLAAQTTTSDQPTSPLSGVVVTTGSTSLVIDTDSGRRTFVIDAQSNVPASLAVGNRVSVEFHPLDGGRMHAARVTIMPATPATGTAAVPTTPSPNEQQGEDPVRRETGGTAARSGSTAMGEQTTTPGTTTGTRVDDPAARTTTTTGTRVDSQTATTNVERESMDQPATTGAMADDPNAGRLPDTASELPLLALAGLTLLAGGIGLRLARRAA